MNSSVLSAVVLCLATIVGVIVYFNRQEELMLTKLKEKDLELKEKDLELKEKDWELRRSKELLDDPDYNKRQAMLAFNKAEEWRSKKVAVIYANVTDDELDNADRWIAYAEPFSSDRSCLRYSKTWAQNISFEDLFINVQKIWSPNFFWNDTCRKSYLTLHAFHTTGIEGNTLTLSETALVINGQTLFAGFKDAMTTPVTGNSLKEVKSIQRIIDALKFSSPPSQEPQYIFNKQTLVDINSAIVDDPNTVGFRRRPVAVGHQFIALPMPDEVDYLVTLYLKWLNDEIEQFLKDMADDKIDFKDIFLRALSISCDAHTRLVHIHPFSDGNGRLARIISGIVLRTVMLPMPMFIRETRHDYIKAVSGATIDRNYSPLCLMHYQAVRRSVNIMINLSKNKCIMV